MNTRRNFLHLIGAAGAASLHAQQRIAKPNVIWIMSDDHAVHATSAYGSKLMPTPNLDRLATEGVRFQNAFCTNSLCAPSRATLLTGKFSHKNGHLDNRTKFDGSQQTFPKLLQKAGYRTGAIGKWHLQSDPTGFDYWNVLPGQGLYYDPVFIEMGEKKKVPGYATDVITDYALKFVKESAGKPFFLFCGHKAPHRRWEPGPKYKSRFEGQDLPEPPTYNDDYSHRSSSAEHAEMRVAVMPDWVKEQPAGMTDEQRKKWNYQRFIKDYLRCIASVDESVGRILQALDESGLAANTVVAYTSDNGFFLGDHGWYDKRFMYEESLRLPLMVRYPGVAQRGHVEERFVTNVDFAPTILDVAGVPVPADMQGRSFVPLLKKQKVSGWPTSAYYHYYEYPDGHRVRPHYGVRTDRYKLIHFPTVNEWEMFDLKADPRELRSVYDDPKYLDVQGKMKAELERLRKQYQDQT